MSGFVNKYICIPAKNFCGLQAGTPNQPDFHKALLHQRTHCIKEIADTFLYGVAPNKQDTKATILFRERAKDGEIDAIGQLAKLLCRHSLLDKGTIGEGRRHCYHISLRILLDLLVHDAWVDGTIRESVSEVFIRQYLILIKDMGRTSVTHDTCPKLAGPACCMKTKGGQMNKYITGLHASCNPAIKAVNGGPV